MTTFSQNIEITVTGSPPDDPDNEGDPVYDAGWEVPPVTGRHASGPKIVGRNKGTATVIYPLSSLRADDRYLVKLTPDWSSMSQGGKGIILGFGFVNSGSPVISDFHIVGQAYDGKEMRIQRVYGSDLESGKNATLTLEDLAAATNGSEDGPNYADIEGSSDGETYTFRTSSAGSVWDDEVTLADPDPFLDLTEPNQFGVGVYVPGNNRGTLSVEIEILGLPIEHIGSKTDRVEDDSGGLTTALPAGAASGDFCFVHGGVAFGGNLTVSGGGAGAWTQAQSDTLPENSTNTRTFYKTLDGTTDIVLQGDSPEAGQDIGAVIMVFRNASFVDLTSDASLIGDAAVNSPSVNAGEALAVMGTGTGFGQIELAGGDVVAVNIPTNTRIPTEARYTLTQTGIIECTCDKTFGDTVVVAARMQKQ